MRFDLEKELDAHSILAIHCRDDRVIHVPITALAAVIDHAVDAFQSRVLAVAIADCERHSSEAVN